jgi:hypothetical protein
MQTPDKSPVTGRKMRFTWNDGPTKGKTYEHVFYENGTDDVYAVSYLAKGYTLTAVLNFTDSSIVGFASDAEHWYPVHGRFEVVD